MGNGREEARATHLPAPQLSPSAGSVRRTHSGQVLGLWAALVALSEPFLHRLPCISRHRMLASHLHAGCGREERSIRAVGGSSGEGEGGFEASASCDADG